MIKDFCLRGLFLLWTGKTLKKIHAQVTLFISLWWPFKNQMKRCDCWQIFWKLATGNRLHNYLSWKLWLFILKFEFPTFRATGNWLHVLCNRLQGFSKFLNVISTSNRLRTHGNRLHLWKTIVRNVGLLVIDYSLLVIDYQKVTSLEKLFLR